MNLFNCFFFTLVLSCGMLAADTVKKNKQVRAILNPTKGNRAQGVVTFTQLEEGGVRIVADVDYLEPGRHGFHIHEFGDCSSPDAASAGGHFNPKKTKHGAPDGVERHAGDLGNLAADERGHAHYDRIDKVITLVGEETIIGRSVVVHSNADDFKTQPTGNAGGRVACGVIEE